MHAAHVQKNIRKVSLRLKLVCILHMYNKQHQPHTSLGKANAQIHAEIQGNCTSNGCMLKYIQTFNGTVLLRASWVGCLFRY